MTSERKTESLRILVADAIEASRLMTCALLQSAGHLPASVTNGEAALALLDVNSFDLILLDIMMPVMDGFKTVRHIKRRNESDIALPVFALTSHADVQDQQLYRQAGFDATLSKPLRVKRLERAVALYDGKTLIPAPESTSVAIDLNIALLDSYRIEHLKRSIGAERLLQIRQSYWQTVQTFLDKTHEVLAAAIRGDTKALTAFREYVHELKAASLTLGLNRVASYARHLQNVPSSEILKCLHLVIKALLQSRSPLALAFAEPLPLIRTG